MGTAPYLAAHQSRQSSTHNGALSSCRPSAAAYWYTPPEDAAMAAGCSSALTKAVLAAKGG